MKKNSFLSFFIVVILISGCTTVPDIKKIPLVDGYRKYYDAPTEDVIKAIEYAVNLSGLKILEVFPTTQYGGLIIIAEKTMTAWSSGELVRVVAKPFEDGTIVRIVTKKKVATQITAVGDYSQNIFYHTTYYLFKIEGKTKKTEKVATYPKREKQTQESLSPDKVEEPKEVLIGTGSGFVIAKDLVVTSAHIVKGATNINIYRGNLTNPLEGKILEIDFANDIAILFVNQSFSGNDILSISENLKIGEDVFTIGYPLVNILGSKPRYSNGTISSTFGIGGDPRFFQITAPLQPGNSGGPILNKDGSVIGMVAHKLNDFFAIETSASIPQNVNFAIKSGYISLLAKSTGKWRNSLKDIKPKSIEDVTKSIVLIEAIK